MMMFEEEVLSSQSIILREKSRRIKVASCQLKDIRQIPADRINIAVRLCVLSPFYLSYQMLCQFASVIFFFFLTYPIYYHFYDLSILLICCCGTFKGTKQPKVFCSLHVIKNIPVNSFSNLFIYFLFFYTVCPMGKSYSIETF